MLDIDRSDEVLEGDVLTGDEPGCVELMSVELVPVTQSVHWSPKRSMARPDPGFVTQLIATAAQAVGLWLNQGTEPCMNQYNG